MFAAAKSAEKAPELVSSNCHYLFLPCLFPSYLSFIAYCKNVLRQQEFCGLLSNMHDVYFIQTRSPSKAASMFSGTQEKCATCAKTAYPLEKVWPKSCSSWLILLVYIFLCALNLVKFSLFRTYMMNNLKKVFLFNRVMLLQMRILTLRFST